MYISFFTDLFMNAFYTDCLHNMYNFPDLPEEKKTALHSF